MKENKHSGSSFDSFLKDEGIFEEVEKKAAAQLTAWKQDQITMDELKKINDLARKEPIVYGLKLQAMYNTDPYVANTCKELLRKLIA